MDKMNHFGLSRTRKQGFTPCLAELDKVMAPVVFEGAELFDKLLPVSKITGNRQSIYECLQMVGNERFSRAIDALLPEIPAIMSDQRLSDDDRVDMLASRLDCGTPSENARMRAQLEKIVDTFKDSYLAKPSESESNRGPSVESASAVESSNE